MSDALKAKSGKRNIQRLACICLMFWLSVSLQVGEAQSEPAPFLYYYSDTLRTFVIERADGTDTRVLSQVTMPEETDDITIRDWSPSGEWLAWTSRIRSGYDNTIDSGWIANVDGTESWEIPTDAGHIYDMIWSPTDDLLFVSDWERPAGEFSYRAAYTQRFFLIDAPTQTVITTFEMELPFANRNLAAWTLDGEYVTFTYTVDAEEGTRSFLRRITRAGEIEDIPIPGVLVWGGLYSNPSRNAWVLSRSEDSSQLITVNIFSGEAITFDALAPIEYIFLYQWNYTGDHVLIYVRTPNSGDKFELWLLSIPDQALQRIADDAGNYANERSTWFPWSFYANHAIFYTDDGLFGLEIEPEVQVTQLADQVSLPQWYGDGRLYFIRRIVDNDGNSHLQAYTYDFLTDTLAGQDMRFSPYRISGDERYAVTENPLAVVDRVQDQVFPIQSHSQVMHGPEYLLEWVYWFRNGPWFMTTETNVGINRGLPTYRRYTSVNNVDGTVHRELSVCDSSCASWLPEQVIAHLDSE